MKLTRMAVLSMASVVPWPLLASLTAILLTIPVIWETASSKNAFSSTPFTSPAVREACRVNNRAAKVWDPLNRWNGDICGAGFLRMTLNLIDRNPRC
jgi:hypothetical protein